jgi:hypothetical protein
MTGNEIADTLAKKAALDTVHDHICDSEATPWKDCYWPHSNNAEGQLYPLNDIRKDARTMALPLKAGPAERKGIYEQAWEDTAPTLDPLSNYYLTSTLCSQAEKINIHKGKWGILWNKKLAARMHTKYNPNDTHIAKDHICPICGVDGDSGGHILGGCTDPHIVKVKIKRHDNAVRHIKTLLYHSQFQKSYIIMDAGGDKNKPKRLPTWLLPNQDKLERTFRPDILIVEGLLDTDIAKGHIPDLTHKEHYKIHILEIGYCPDTRAAERFPIKAEQHSLLRDLLIQQGWQVEPIHPLIFGVCGSIYTNTRVYLTNLLKTKPKYIQKTLKQIHLNSIHKAHQMVKLRRHLEHNKGPRGVP